MPALPWSQRRHLLVLLLAALTLLVPRAPRAQEGGEVEAGQDRKAEKRAREDARKGEEQARREAKRSKKKQTDEQKARARFETSGKTAAEWYADARRHYDAGKYLKAREILLPLEDSPRALDIQEKVKLLIADTYYLQGGTLNLAEALARYRTFLTFHPESAHAEYVQFQIGNSYFRQLGPTDRDQSYTDNAIAEYQRLLDQHPESEHADEARKNLLEAKARRAQHEYEVAQFYWEWKNYQAAGDRFGEMLHERPELPQREQAIYFAAESFYRSGRAEDGDAYAARLAADYPSSPWLRRLSKGKAVSVHAREADKVAAKRRAETERTHRRMLSREQARTRQIRKDSGLPGKIPNVLDDAGRPEAVAWTAPADRPLSSKEQQRQAKSSGRAERAERDEQAQAAESASRTSKGKPVKAAKPRSAQQEAKDAKEAAKRAAKDAKRAAKEAKRAAKLEAAEQAEAAKKARSKKGE